jgi:hypothetical protein
MSYEGRFCPMVNSIFETQRRIIDFDSVTGCQHDEFNGKPCLVVYTRDRRAHRVWGSDIPRFKKEYGAYKTLRALFMHQILEASRLKVDVVGG